MIEDKLLILKFKSGSADALSKIYNKYRIALLKLALALSNDRAAAEDAVHDVFLAMAQSPAKLRLTGSLRSYLATCVANRIRNHNKRAMRSRTIDADAAGRIASERTDPRQWIIADERTNMVNNAVAQLPYEQRETVLLRLHGRMKFKSIARIQGVSINTAQSRYRYGLEKLKSLLADEAQT
jgi:RNA polymerase sigma-70 factor (ECF subfamily)